MPPVAVTDMHVNLDHGRYISPATKNTKKREEERNKVITLVLVCAGLGTTAVDRHAADRIGEKEWVTHEIC